MAFTPSWRSHMSPEDKLFYKDLGQRIAAARKAQGLTQVQLAETLGIAQQTMAHYEGGSLRISVSLLKSLTKALNTSFDDLINEPTAATKKRGPKSRLDQQIDIISDLPRSKQKFISDMLDALIQQQKAS
mgnify:CR=1 FL=1